MEFKCPECGYVSEIFGSIEYLENCKKSDTPVIHRCIECDKDCDALENIQYKPPTGGTGEVDLSDSKLSPPNMSLRDYFAGQAIIGALNGDEDRIISDATRANVSVHELIAVSAYKFADAMLKERNK